MFECFERPEHMPLWTAAARGDIPDWDRLLSGYGAAIDFPPAAFWPELMRAYPEALILLSVREINRIVILNATAKEVLWEWGKGWLQGQHHATLLDNGNILKKCPSDTIKRIPPLEALAEQAE